MGREGLSPFSGLANHGTAAAALASIDGVVAHRTAAVSVLSAFSTRSSGFRHAETASTSPKAPMVSSFKIMVGPLFLRQAKPIVCSILAKRASFRTGSSNGSFLNRTNPASRSARACSNWAKASSFLPHWASTWACW